MNVTTDLLLSHLPPYRDAWVLIHPDQTVKDIIKEVVDAHREFSEYYDRIALYFDEPTTPDISEGIYEFLKANVAYKEEDENSQTTALPTGILMRGEGDCKHYAGFAGGILAALERAKGKKIDWAYRFASYDPSDSTPHHVFIVVRDGGQDLWIDPTPGSQGREPIYYVDKKPKQTMALHRNIAGTARIGVASLYVNLFTDWGKAMQFAGAPWPYQWPPSSPWLGYDMYQDYGGDRNINETDLAARLNAAIANGPDPGHTIDPAFAKWVYANSIRSWNFYYKGGVDPNFNPTSFIPKTFSWVDAHGTRQTIVPPLWVLTKDNRVTFDHDVQLDDYENWLIHVLTAWAQTFINKYDAAPFPLKPRDLKLFSQTYTGNPNNPAASILKEWRATSDLTKIIQATTTFISNTVLKVIGAIPRNAFLAIVGINLFHMATDLQNHINAGGWSEIAGKWQSLGGDPSKLLSTIHHGSTVPETDNTQATVNSADQVTGIMAPAPATIGNPAVIAAIITTATPIILALAKYFTHSSVAGITQTGVNGLNAANPAGGYQMVNGQLYSNGQPVNFQGETAAQAAQSAMIKNGAIALAVGGVLYFITKKKGQKGKILLPAGGAVATFLLLQYRSNQQLQLSQPAAVVPQAVPSTSTATPGILPTVLPLVNTLITALPQSQPTPTSPVTAGSGSDLPAGYSGAGTDLYAV